MKFDFLSTKDRDAIDNRKMINMYYHADVKNEWEYEDEILHMNGFKKQYVYYLYTFLYM